MDDKDSPLTAVEVALKRTNHYSEAKLPNIYKIIQYKEKIYDQYFESTKYMRYATIK